MHEDGRASTLWTEQPVEDSPMNPPEILMRRTGELYARTRAEALMSIAAALVLALVLAVRFAPEHNPLVYVVLAAIGLWTAISFLRLRRRLRREEPSARDLAVSGIEHYRRELLRRRDHLGDFWVWYGPLLLACCIVPAIFIRQGNGGRIWAVAPLAALLIAWTIVDFLRRRRQARELQKEIEELQSDSQA